VSILEPKAGTSHTRGHRQQTTAIPAQSTAAWTECAIDFLAHMFIFRGLTGMITTQDGCERGTALVALSSGWAFQGSSKGSIAHACPIQTQLCPNPAFTKGWTSKWLLRERRMELPGLRLFSTPPFVFPFPVLPRSCPKQLMRSTSSPHSERV
jgi:hypothetical protein